MASTLSRPSRAWLFLGGYATLTGIVWRWLVEAGSGRRGLLISKGWVQAVALVVLFGFFVLGLLAYRAYSGQPPIPDRVVDSQGEVVFTSEDVRAGQGVFLRNGLMQYGSIFGHGAYLGPDFTADYLRRSALFVRESYGGGFRPGSGADRLGLQREP